MIEEVVLGVPCRQASARRLLERGDPRQRLARGHAVIPNHFRLGIGVAADQLPSGRRLPNDVEIETLAALLPHRHLESRMLQVPSAHVGPVDPIHGRCGGKGALPPADLEPRLVQDAPLEDVDKVGPPLLAEALRRMRRGEVKLRPGYDGEYGVVRMFDEGERDRLLAQTAFSFLGASARQAETPRPSVPAAAMAEAAAPLPLPVGANPEQNEAVGYGQGPLLIVAGPGTGKTRTLVERIAHLLREKLVAPSEITAITFTRKAATELRDRLVTLLGEAGRGVAVQTFHSLGLEILRRHADAAGLPQSFVVLDEPARLTLLGQVLEARGEPLSSRARLANVFSASKAALAEPPEAGDVFRAYQRALADAGAVDFDDLVGRAVHLLETRESVLWDARQRCRHLLVDEYQDINAAQYRLIRLLAPPAGPLCAVGDPDQAIYGFRGSDPTYFGCFNADYPEARTITLVRNYRSRAPILRLATAVIEAAPGRQPRPLQPLRGEGPMVSRHLLPDECSEATFIASEIEALVAGTSFLSKHTGRAADGPALAFHEIAVLVRLAAQAEAIEEALDRAGLPCQRLGDDALTTRPHVADILARLRRHLEKSPAPPSVADLLPTLVPEAALDPRQRKALDFLCTLAVPFGGDATAFLAEMALARETDVQHEPQKVVLLTLHASKGLEFPVVFIAGCEEGILPLRLPWLPPGNMDEERRLLYVGMTRARERLILTATQRRQLAGHTVEYRPCPFLEGLPDGLLTEVRSAPRRRKAKQLSLL